MANQFIGDYPTITSVTQDTDLVPIVQGGELKTATPNSILGHSSYIFRLAQSGTSAPTATVLLNTTGGTITWTRTNTGRYEFPLPTGTTPFINGLTDWAGGTTVYLVPKYDGTNDAHIYSWYDANKFYLVVRKDDGTYLDLSTVISVSKLDLEIKFF